MTRLHSILQELSMPVGELQMFGSSANGFGNNGSDVDISLLSSPGADAPSSEDLIEGVSTLLEQHGMANLTDRRTARIPIVTFDDPQTGLECDICLNNLLAVHNTQLLRTYGRADPRVRPLAYVIKRW